MKRSSSSLSCLLLAIALVLAAARPVRSQSWLRGYYQNVPLWSGSSPLTEGGASDFNRGRLSISRSFGAFSFDLAYEHVLTLRRRDTAGFLVGAVPSGGEWLPLQWTLEESEHLLWQHRFDRLSVGLSPTSTVQLDVGRQAVSWATTLFLSPADPFSPFDPADPFREFRAGVDAARVRFYPGPLSEVDVVVRPTETAVGDELTALARGLTTWKGWEVSGWAGVVYDDVAGAGAAAGSIGSWAVRGEAVVRESNDALALRASVGVDRLFNLLGRDLLFAAEYQRDDLAAGSAEDYAALFEGPSFRRGELQVLGRDEAVVQTSWQIHPLWGVAGLLLWNLSDGSALLAPSFSYSASDNTTLSGGLFAGVGASVAEGLLLASEYGAAPLTLYVSFSRFF